MKPRFEIADIVRSHTAELLKKHPQPKQVIKTLQAIAQCRTAALGGHASRCQSCGTIRYHYNSCRNRHCPKCQAVNRERWIMQREAELLPLAYYHIVFTLPAELEELTKQYPRQVYSSLFRAGWQTIQLFALDHKYLGAKTGMTAILHTWGQQLWLHPHIHCIVPGGGITAYGKWKNAKGKGKYLFPKRAMSKVFRAKFMAALRACDVMIPQETAKLLFRKNWIVYAKRPFASPKTVVEYLGRYTHKIAISNHRLLSVEGGKVTFKYKNYRKNGVAETMNLDAVEFLRRFCLHILPPGFVRMRHYGILASRNKQKELNIAKEAHGMDAWQKVEIAWEEIAKEKLGINPGQCSKCGGKMEVHCLIAPQRGPPVINQRPEYVH